MAGWKKCKNLRREAVLEFLAIIWSNKWLWWTRLWIKFHVYL